jgi:hypothetical protein
LKGEKGDDGIPGVNGEDGRNAYIYIRYSDDGINFTANNGLTPGKYIGVLFGGGELDLDSVNKPSSYEPWQL